MEDKDIIKVKIEEKKLIKDVEKTTHSTFHTNPIIQKMLRCNALSEKMKFKFKDLFR